MKTAELEQALARADALPPERAGPTFREPWHARAFALAVALHAGGHFSWAEWAAALAAALRETPGTADPEEGYYLAWLTALERLGLEKGLVGEAERRARERAADDAARPTPHAASITRR